MVCVLKGGQRTWSCSRDNDGYRTYKIVWFIEASKLDGPANVLDTPGLPAIGSPWIFDDDLDLWVWCRPETTVTPQGPRNQPNEHWEVEQTFSNRPLARCYDSDIEDPLLEPPKISGTFITHRVEAAYDREGIQLTNLAHEQLKGPLVEFDSSNPTVRIEQNVAALDLFDLCDYIDHVNDTNLWRFAPRCIKLSKISWERKFTGQCDIYYNRSLEFEINKEKWDRLIVSEGNKCLKGQWNKNTGDWDDMDIAPGIPPDPTNPAHFIQFPDRSGHHIRGIHDANGRPFSGAIASAASIPIEKYDEANFLLLGIPTEF